VAELARVSASLCLPLILPKALAASAAVIFSLQLSLLSSLKPGAEKDHWS
jgi:hypothetical protein